MPDVPGVGIVIAASSTQDEGERVAVRVSGEFAR